MIVIKSALRKVPQLLLFFPNFSYSTVQKICTVFFLLCPPQKFDEISPKNFVKALVLVYGHCFFDLSLTRGFRGETLHLLQECIVH